MSPRAQPEQQTPPVQRLRVRYAKRGPARFTSHRDFSRAFERALRRADVPMAYSSGFSPHPRISYANASPTGAATEAEYLEIALVAVCDPGSLRDALDAALPSGLDVLDVAPARPESLTELLQVSRWRIRLDEGPQPLADAVGAFLAADEVPVERMTKTGMRRFDARAAVLSLREVDAELDLVARQGTPLVRPDDVVAGMRILRPGLGGDTPPLLSRVEQGPLLDDGSIGDPLAAVQY